jgi:hypothetical protein
MALSIPRQYCPFSARVAKNLVDEVKTSGAVVAAYKVYEVLAP